MKEASPPVSAMATPTNGSGNLVDEFEEAFQVGNDFVSLSPFGDENIMPTMSKF
mgnify:CR=1 FL=1